MKRHRGYRHGEPSGNTDEAAAKAACPEGPGEGMGAFCAHRPPSVPALLSGDHSAELGGLRAGPILGGRHPPAAMPGEYHRDSCSWGQGQHAGPDPGKPGPPPQPAAAR